MVSYHKKRIRSDKTNIYKSSVSNIIKKYKTSPIPSNSPIEFSFQTMISSKLKKIIVSIIEHNIKKSTHEHPIGSMFCESNILYIHVEDIYTIPSMSISTISQLVVKRQQDNILSIVFPNDLIINQILCNLILEKDTIYPIIPWIYSRNKIKYLFGYKNFREQSLDTLRYIYIDICLNRTNKPNQKQKNRIEVDLKHMKKIIEQYMKDIPKRISIGNTITIDAYSGKYLGYHTFQTREGYNIIVSIIRNSKQKRYSFIFSEENDINKNIEDKPYITILLKDSTVFLETVSSEMEQGLGWCGIMLNILLLLIEEWRKSDPEHWNIKHIYGKNASYNLSKNIIEVIKDPFMGDPLNGTICYFKNISRYYPWLFFENELIHRDDLLKKFNHDIRAIAEQIKYDDIDYYKNFEDA